MGVVIPSDVEGACGWCSLSTALARSYGVTTGALVQAVKRNRNRFPEDFMFQLTRQEFANLRSQIVISSSATGRNYGGRR